MSDLYNRIYELCQNKGITIGRMCKELGISRGNLTELKMGRIKTLKTDNLRKIAYYFKVPLDYLVGDTLNIIGKARIDIGLPLEQLCLMTDISYDRLQRIESGAILPTFSEALRITASLAIPIAQVKYTEDPDPYSDDVLDADEDTPMPNYLERAEQIFTKLNQNGIEEALKRIEELSEIPKYQFNESADS